MSPSPTRVVCALVLIEDHGTVREASVPEEIRLQPLDASPASTPSGPEPVPGLGSSEKNRDDVFIGRQLGHVDVAMDCTSIPLLLSRRHAALTCDGTAHYVKDLATTNGTFVNGKRIPSKEEVKLSPGDVVAFGGPRYVARDAGRLQNPFRFRYVRLEQREASEVGGRKRLRLSQDSDGIGEYGGMEMSQGLQPSQSYFPVPTSQSSEIDEELDDKFKARLREVFEGGGELAQACAKQYFGVSPMTSPKKASPGEQLVKLSRSSDEAKLTMNSAMEMLPDLVVERLRQHEHGGLSSSNVPSWLDAELKCSVCIDYMVSPQVLTGCGHVFCLDCIDNAFCHTYRCPVCRARPQAPRDLLFTPSVLTSRILDECIIPKLSTKEMLARAAREQLAQEAREKRVKLSAELAEKRARAAKSGDARDDPTPSEPE